MNSLNESSIEYNSYGLSIRPLNVYIETSECVLRIPRKMFKRIAKWYLEDQIKEK